MSRIGRTPIPLPEGVSVDISGQKVTVAGPKGELRHTVVEPIRVSESDGTLVVTRPTDRGAAPLPPRALAHPRGQHGPGRERRLRAAARDPGRRLPRAAQGASLELAVGFSHPVTIEPPEGIQFEVPAPTQIVVRGIDKQAVGQVAAEIRAVRPPEPYKGKGIRYAGEVVRRKVGKERRA